MSVMKTNVDKVINRGERLEELSDKTGASAGSERPATSDDGRAGRGSRERAGNGPRDARSPCARALAEDLSQMSLQFKTRSRQLRRTLWWNNVKVRGPRRHAVLPRAPAHRRRERVSGRAPPQFTVMIVVIILVVVAILIGTLLAGPVGILPQLLTRSRASSRPPPPGPGLQAPCTLLSGRPECIPGMYSARAERARNARNGARTRSGRFERALEVLLHQVAGIGRMAHLLKRFRGGFAWCHIPAHDVHTGRRVT